MARFLLQIIVILILTGIAWMAIYLLVTFLRGGSRQRPVAAVPSEQQLAPLARDEIPEWPIWATRKPAGVAAGMYAATVYDDEVYHLLLRSTENAWVLELGDDRGALTELQRGTDKRALERRFAEIYQMLPVELENEEKHGNAAIP